MSYSSEVLADSPDVLLVLDETSGTVAADSSGNARDFGAANVTWAQTSLLADGTGTSAILNGTNAFFSLADALWMNSGSITCEFRYKHTTAAGNRIFVGRWGSGGHRPWLLYVGANKLVAQFDDSGPAITGATTLSNGGIYTLALRTDGSTAKLYANGVEDASISHAGLTQAGAPLDIGRASLNAFTAGQVDGFAFWASAVSPTRLAAHHAAAASTGPSGTGSLSLSGSSGAAASAAGSGALSLTGSGSASAPVAGSGSLSLTGTGAIDFQPAAGTGSLSLSGTGGAGIGVAGSASLDLIATGTALASAIAAGTATLTLTATGSAVMSSGGTAVLTLTAGGVAVALYETDLSNALDGLDLLLTATVTFAVPVAPPSSSLNVKYDKAIAYPVPTMVGGRPT